MEIADIESRMADERSKIEEKNNQIREEEEKRIVENERLKGLCESFFAMSSGKEAEGWFIANQEHRLEVIIYHTNRGSENFVAIKTLNTDTLVPRKFSLDTLMADFIKDSEKTLPGQLKKILDSPKDQVIISKKLHLDS